MNDFDVIIVGGGHAGVEASLVVSRMGLTAGLVTMERSKLALMSCNPAIGGIGKSHLVKEVDALGGIMGLAIDATGIQFRKLNLSRGPAVWSTRVQADRRAYNDYIVSAIEQDKNITVIEGIATEITVEHSSVKAITLKTGDRIRCKAVVITTGTFLGGLIHIGEQQIRAGRLGEDSATELSQSFLSLGFEVGRLKTGTPPRLNADTIDFSVCEVQPGETPIPFFSDRSPKRVIEQENCYLTYTTEKTKEIVSRNFKLSPMFSGQIHSTGPRYCPSIEDKFYRFADKKRHQIFLEPEGNNNNEIYPNGFSTALPESVQLDAIRTIIGLEHVEITRPGYAVEYDFCPAFQIKPSFETKRVKHLFLAGQINGTSGYEEAAAQGLMAGINAVLSIIGEEPFVLDRSEAYIGVMIDDLTTRSTTEPYRMFTSRAEYRLFLREDNARDRLNKYASKYKLLDEATCANFDAQRIEMDRIVKNLHSTRVRIDQLGNLAQRFKRMETTTLANVICQPSLTLLDAIQLVESIAPEFSGRSELMERAAIYVRYEGYIDKQEREVQKFRNLEKAKIPASFDFNSMVGLKMEAREKFTHFRPSTIGQAGRIEGITPGDIAVLSIYVKRFKEMPT